MKLFKIILIITILLSLPTSSLISNNKFVYGISLESINKRLSTLYQKDNHLIIFSYNKEWPPENELTSQLDDLKKKAEKDKKKGHQTILLYIESKDEFGVKSTAPYINDEFLRSIRINTCNKLNMPDSGYKDSIAPFIYAFTEALPIKNIPIPLENVPRTCGDTFGKGKWKVCQDGLGANCCAIDANCNNQVEKAPYTCCPKYSKSKGTKRAGGINYCEKTDKYCETKFGSNHKACGTDCCYIGPTIPGEKFTEKCIGKLPPRCVKAKGKCDPSVGEKQCGEKIGIFDRGYLCCLSHEECKPIEGKYICLPKKESCEEQGKIFCPGLKGSRFEIYSTCCPPTHQCWWHPAGTPYCVKKISQDFALAGRFGGMNEHII